jgi:transcriptional regulator with XRE-family HTH domain
MTPEQLRAVRNGLGWTQVQLAAKAQVSLSTIEAYEAGHPDLDSYSRIRSALEAAGVKWTNDGPIVVVNG